MTSFSPLSHNIEGSTIFLSITVFRVFLNSSILVMVLFKSFLNSIPAVLLQKVVTHRAGGGAELGFSFSGHAITSSRCLLNFLVFRSISRITACIVSISGSSK